MDHPMFIQSVIIIIFFLNNYLWNCVVVLLFLCLCWLYFRRFRHWRFYQQLIIVYNRWKKCKDCSKWFDANRFVECCFVFVLFILFVFFNDETMLPQSDNMIGYLMVKNFEFIFPPNNVLFKIANGKYYSSDTTCFFL